MTWIDRIGRRTFLRGVAGATLALPVLEYTDALAQDTRPRAKRLIVLFSHGGTIISCSRTGARYSHANSTHHGFNDWAPVDPGETLRPGAIMEPLDQAGLTPYLLLPTGVDNMTGRTAAYGGGHKSSNASSLTCARWTEEERVRSCLLYTSPSPRDVEESRMPSSA